MSATCYPLKLSPFIVRCFISLVMHQCDSNKPGLKELWNKSGSKRAVIGQRKCLWVQFMVAIFIPENNGVNIHFFKKKAPKSPLDI